MSWFRKEKKESIQQTQKIIIPDSLSLQMLMVMEEAIQKIQPVPDKKQYPVRDYDLETPPEIKKLINLGFENTEKVRKYKEELQNKEAAYTILRDNVKEFNDHREAIIKENNKLFEKFKFLLKIRQIYGKDTLLLPYRAFFDILERNNLACGLFKDYLGEIPEDKLQEIQDLTAIQPPEEIETLYKITYFSVIPEDSYWKKSIELLPFHFGRAELMTKAYNRGIGVYEKPSGRYSYQVLYNGDYVTTFRPKYGSFLSDERVGTRFFIVAPEQLMKGKVIIRDAPNPDPLICAFSKYGIIVTVRWGEEASDEVIRRFEAFSKNLDKLGL